MVHTADLRIPSRGISTLGHKESDSSINVPVWVTKKKGTFFLLCSYLKQLNLHVLGPGGRVPYCQPSVWQNYVAAQSTARGGW